MRWCAEDLGWALRWRSRVARFIVAKLHRSCLPVGGGAGHNQCFALKAIEVALTVYRLSVL